MRSLSLLSLSAAIPVVTGISASPSAQQQPLPSLMVPAVVTTTPTFGAQVPYSLSAVPGAGYAVLLDISGGPVHFAGERIQLGLTPSLVVFAAGVLPPVGTDTGSLGVQASLGSLGVPFYLEAVVLNPMAPNGLFETSNGESTTLLGVGALVERFDAPAREGFDGTFDRGVEDRLQGGPVRVRTHRTVDPQGVPFPAPLASPLHPDGSRLQVCFRAVDVGATGEEELVTAVRWRLFGSTLASDRFDRFELTMAHSHVVPDYTIDPFSALPAFPNSGLDPVYALNVKPGETLQSLYSGPYVIQPQDLRHDGYVDYPLARSFTYNGVDSLLLDFRTTPSPSALGLNGQVVRLMVQSSPQPNGRVVSTPGLGDPPVDPYAVTSGRGDNAMYDYQVEFTRVKTLATSPWRGPHAGGADYQAPVVARITPPGTSVSVEYRGADDAQGNGSTSWSSSVDIADGKAFLQFRVTLVANAATGAAPSIDSLVVPIR